MIDAANVTTSFELPGLIVVHNMGLVRGMVLRLPHPPEGFKAALSKPSKVDLVALNADALTLYRELCEKAREEAFENMLQHAAQLGANAVIGVRYDANQVTQGVTEVLAYGTAVLVR